MCVYHTEGCMIKCKGSLQIDSLGLKQGAVGECSTTVKSVNKSMSRFSVRNYPRRDGKGSKMTPTHLLHRRKSLRKIRNLQVTKINAF